MAFSAALKIYCSTTRHWKCVECFKLGLHLNESCNMNKNKLKRTAELGNFL